MNIKFDAALVSGAIHALFAAHPGLFDDDEAVLLVIESETNAIEFLTYVVKQIHDTDDLINGTSSRILELRARGERLKRRTEALRSLAMKVIEATGLKSIPLQIATLSLRTNPPKVIVTDEAAVPDDYCRFKREPDKTKLATCLKSGLHVAGAVLSNQEISLSIRVK